MAAFKVKNLWSAFITAFFALLASVGLTTAAAAQQPAPAVQQTPDEPSTPRAQAVRAFVPAQSTRQSMRWNPTARDRSLPPTIKQRIHAEAHGSSPATRHLPAVDADSADASPSSASATAAGPAPAAGPAAESAPVADPVLTVLTAA
ncbi:DUF6344 domain-containing protein [Streptomyces sp. NBC_01142]|uniref:DUF6344 domain-containing protein n=1 Tax=Streptomyces sp. NBC_01142 TaxID=2975865 RepID=UPI002257DA59|nr:DUF6344 domain-containing protein [Streptomyces sp. NBC_01142]MCX4824413.1 DUF6344 domain-containing protein [Streptomyces sp. NBC_01142]